MSVPLTIRIQGDAVSLEGTAPLKQRTEVKCPGNAEFASRLVATSLSHATFKGLFSSTFSTSFLVRAMVREKVGAVS